MTSDEKRIEDELSYPIQLTVRVCSAVDEAKLFKVECTKVAKQVNQICQMLRIVVQLATITPSLYQRPIKRIVAEVSKNLERALTLVCKCKRKSFLRRVVTITRSTHFRKLFNLLESSVGDIKWFLSINNTDTAGGIVLSLPSIASNDPILSWVWSFIASIQMGQLPDRIEAANELASLAEDNDRNKKIIVEEGGIPPLLKLLKECSSPEAQISAATALYYLANVQERVRTIVNEIGIPDIVLVLGDSPMKVQTWVASLVARMAEHDRIAQEDFALDNVIRPLVKLLSFENFLDDPTLHPGKQNIRSMLQVNKEIEKKSLGGSSNGASNRTYKNSTSHSNLYSYSYKEGSSRGRQGSKERENEKPEVKLQLKISCAKALWMLAKGSVSNCQRITETKGLLCLAKLVEEEVGELQFNCLMTIMEISAAAEFNADLRREAFKTNSPASKAVVDQLLRIMKEVDSSTLKIPSIRSIGSLARTFPARETRVISLLVAHLGHQDMDVAMEAAVSLGKFACPDNFLHIEHSKTITEFNGIPSLLRLLRRNQKSQFHGLVLLCYLALHAFNSNVVEKARFLTALEGVNRTLIAQWPELKELVSRAVYHLNLYHKGAHSQRQSLSYVP